MVNIKAQEVRNVLCAGSRLQECIFLMFQYFQWVHMRISPTCHEYVSEENSIFGSLIIWTSFPLTCMLDILVLNNYTLHLIMPSSVRWMLIGCVFCRQLSYWLKWRGNDEEMTGVRFCPQLLSPAHFSHSCPYLFIKWRWKTVERRRLMPNPAHVKICKQYIV